eukprot:1929542-Pyramimonas_sp.AAC.1
MRTRRRGAQRRRIRRKRRRNGKEEEDPLPLQLMAAVEDMPISFGTPPLASSKMSGMRPGAFSAAPREE